MPNEPNWISVEGVIETNQIVVEASEEPFALLNRGGLEAACARPQQYWGYGERDIIALSVKALFGIAQAHPFQQGNKRTAFLTAAIFLEDNGYFIETGDDRFAEPILRVIDRKQPEAHFLEIWRSAIVPADNR